MFGKGVMGVCQERRSAAPTKFASLYWTYGMLILYKHGSINTLLSGWFSVGSLIRMPFLLIGNLITFASTIPMESTERPSISLHNADAAAILAPYKDEIIQRLAKGEHPIHISFQIAPRAGLTASEVKRYIQAERLQPAPQS